MKAPYVIEHETYLNDIQRDFAARRTEVDPTEYSKKTGLHLRGLVFAAVIVALGAFAPWSALPM